MDGDGVGPYGQDTRQEEIPMIGDVGHIQGPGGIQLETNALGASGPFVYVPNKADGYEHNNYIKSVFPGRFESAVELNLDSEDAPEAATRELEKRKMFMLGKREFGRPSGTLWDGGFNGGEKIILAEPLQIQGKRTWGYPPKRLFKLGK